MWDQVGQLYAYHGDVPAEVRLLKLTEEVGEVADAFIGMRGRTPEETLTRRWLSSSPSASRRTSRILRISTRGRGIGAFSSDTGAMSEKASQRP